MDNKMTNEQLDALFRKVFDDGEPGDAALLAETDSAVMAKEAQVLSHLKSGLADLADIPECQIGTDRLRDAILNRGAMPERTPMFPNWFKAALPIAACAAIGAFLVVNKPANLTQYENSVKPSTEVVNKKVAAQGAKAEEFNTSSSDVMPATMTGAAEPEVKASLPEGFKARFVAKKASSAGSLVASSKSVASGTALGGASAQDIANAVDTARRSNSVAGTASSALKDFAGLSGESTAVPSASAPSSEPKVVIVTAGTDPQSRANNATEVDKKNVVFGG